MQSTLKRESKVPEIVLGEAFERVTCVLSFIGLCCVLLSVEVPKGIRLAADVAV